MRRVGILGGMGPQATILLMQKILDAVPATDDADAKPSQKKGEKKEKKKQEKEGAGAGAGGEKELAGGVKAKDTKAGTGPAAKKGDTVYMRYTGKLEDGSVFDSNAKGKPVSFFPLPVIREKKSLLSLVAW